MNAIANSLHGIGQVAIHLPVILLAIGAAVWAIRGALTLWMRK